LRNVQNNAKPQAVGNREKLKIALLERDRKIQLVKTIWIFLWEIKKNNKTKKCIFILGEIS